MKSGSSSRNRLLSYLRIGSGVILMSAAAALAFVAANPSGSFKSPTRPPFAGKLTSEDLVGAFGEPGNGQHGDDVVPSDSEQGDISLATQQDYLHRAYPAAEVSVKDTVNAQNAWTKVKAKKLAKSATTPGSWTLIGPSNAQF